MQNESSACLVYVTVADAKEAEAIGRALVEERLAACVNILDGMRSLYWWEGVVQEGSEVVLIAKTGSSRLEALVQRVKALHSYECPCVVAIPIVGGNPQFLEWVHQQTEANGEGQE